jgi:hypothetical protein
VEEEIITTAISKRDFNKKAPNIYRGFFYSSLSKVLVH